MPRTECENTRTGLTKLVASPNSGSVVKCADSGKKQSGAG